MRQITSDAIDAFENFENFKRSNTQCVNTHVGVNLYLHGNLIAFKSLRGRMITVTLAGYNTRTTRERLNGISGVHIICRNGQAFIKDGSSYQSIEDNEEIVLDENRNIIKS